MTVEFDPVHYDQLRDQARVGGQAEVMAYTEGHGILRAMGKGFMWLMSWLSYAY